MRLLSAGHIAAFSTATLASASILASRSNAQSPSLEEAVVDAFVANCVLNLPNLERIRAASRMFGWKPISGDAVIMLGPLDRGAKFEGWSASDKEARFFIGISTGNLGAQPVVSCTVANPELQQNAVLEQLQKTLNLKFLNDEREAGQRYRSWTTPANSYSVLVTLTTMQDPSSSGGSLSAAVKVK